ncbi:uncharacterized protein N7446_007129 [Penicillium canescens]|uniref:Uncharacterized protein n=1 Tax=Penicillium canescens TaxID=5083 RepID=A0AAD6ILT6_PENCN|nr:uncharacterized protein N7446_007129 [Penicillium canescens]KAJ6049543.1 hypothetical protein N7444_006259 [Penicillium canescens]KAJ6052489.1 hypothetical protein N7460_003023 [Penicillium canescens]KAJ6063009.1 hypothetical protein N7446_007129 [Penicillium canescens]
MALFVKTIFAPEFIAVEGLQEWAQCRRMERECSGLTEGQFKIVHAFYISMLALRYRTPNGDRVIWPNQYTWLLQQRLSHWGDALHQSLLLDDICDKNKSDSAAKFLALIQLESMTLGYIPLFIVTYFFWWNKPKDIRSPSIVGLPDMTPEQMQTFESMAVSNKFDNEGIKHQVSHWNVWYLTPRVFEKEEEDRIMREARATSEKLAKNSIQTANPNPDITYTTTNNESEAQNIGEQVKIRKDIVVAHWDPGLYRSKIWPVTCLFGVSFGALHLVSWNTIFPTIIELWLWRASAFVSIVSMLIFMHFEKVVLRWDGFSTFVSLGSAVLYILSRIVMMGEVFAALRGEESAIYDTYAYSAYWLPFL